jgi:hypothetical protein
VSLEQCPLIPSVPANPKNFEPTSILHDHNLVGPTGKLAGAPMSGACAGATLLAE